MGTYIVAVNNGFEAIEFENNKRPLNLVLEVPDHTANNRNNFLLVTSGVEVSWNNYYGTSRWRIVEVKYKNTIIYEANNIHKVQSVIDTLNKFKNISKKDLEDLYQDAQEKEKTELEITIEKLKLEKNKLEEQIKIYKEIQTKKEEIKELLAKLD